MKKLSTALLVLFFSSLLSAQVKNYVGIVREKYYPSHEEFLNELADSLKRRGYSSYADYVKDYLKGGFGSGFIYVDKDGTNYVITNRHVVSQAASASIEFENENGSTTKYENLSVVITDDDIDLAILRFEGNAKPFKAGLTFSNTKLSDGQNVCSAGFPGLGNDPVWQFGKGSVTNASARIKELIEPSISTVIQHSAQIDAGNSGGPLLIESKTAATGYEVVGINTWKAVGRDATNFSIPAQLALDLLKKSKMTSDDAAEKTKRSEMFKKTISDSANDYTSIVKFVSYDFASKYGEDYFDEILRYASSKVRNRIISEFAYDPIEGLRYAVAYNLYDEFSGENSTEENLSKITWSKEHGLYRITSVGEDKKSKKSSNVKHTTKASGSKKSSDKKKKAVKYDGLESPYTFAITGGIMLPFEKDIDNIDLGTPFVIGAEIFPELGFFGTKVEFERLELGTEQMNLFGVGAAFRIPLSYRLFTICPKAEAGLKVCFGDIRDFHVYADVGINTTFNLGIDYIRPGFEVSVRGMSDSLTTSEMHGEDIKLKSAAVVAKLILGISLD